MTKKNEKSFKDYISVCCNLGACGNILTQLEEEYNTNSKLWEAYKLFGCVTKFKGGVQDILHLMMYNKLVYKDALLMQIKNMQILKCIPLDYMSSIDSKVIRKIKFTKFIDNEIMIDSMLNIDKYESLSFQTEFKIKDCEVIETDLVSFKKQGNKSSDKIVTYKNGDTGFTDEITISNGKLIFLFIDKNIVEFREVYSTSNGICSRSISANDKVMHKGKIVLS